tara:strand:- start:747 stop:1172 length:426 start_codon:yes stop_codon:yes gene_type:complete
MHLTNAPTWKRLLAFIYDGLIVTALVLISGLIASLIAQGEAPTWLTRLIILTSVGGYFWWSWSHGGRTAGMLAWRLRLVGLGGETITNDVAFKRLIICLFTLAPMGVTLLTGLLSPIGQTIYDLLSKTRVIAEPKPQKSAH